MERASLYNDEFPEGRLDRIYLHWTAGDYLTTYPSYHYCVIFDGQRAQVEQTHDLRANMRDVKAEPDRPYAAHTAGRNSFAAGLSIAAMRHATPKDFGMFPMREEAIDALCRVAAALARRYDIPVDKGHVMTHAEAALDDGYFGEAEDQRWDIARLAPRPGDLTEQDARETGEQLRAWIRNAGRN